MSGEIQIGTELMASGQDAERRAVLRLLGSAAPAEVNALEGTRGSEVLAICHARPVASWRCSSTRLLPRSCGASVLLCFRPEVVRTVTRVADPNKEERQETPSGLRLSPRRSFEQWAERVHQHAVPWLPHERAAAVRLRSGLLNVVHRRVEALERTQRLRDELMMITAHKLKTSITARRDHSQLNPRRLHRGDLPASETAASAFHMIDEQTRTL